MCLRSYYDDLAVSWSASQFQRLLHQSELICLTLFLLVSKCLSVSLDYTLSFTVSLLSSVQVWLTYTHTHTLAQGFPCCLGDEMPAFLSAKDSVGSVCVFVCWWIRGCTGVGSRRVPGFPPNESGRQSAPRSAHSPQGYLGNSDRGLPSSAPLCSTIISLSLLEQ